MAAEPNTFYPHRHNRDGTFDSICLKCFLTVAHTETEAELLAYDRVHVCQYWAVSRRVLGRRIKEKMKQN
jgi:hypothetical protein